MFERTYKDRSALTKAEEALLDALQHGATVTGAAKAIGISPKTANNRINSILNKLCVDTTAQAVEEWRARRGA